MKQIDYEKEIEDYINKNKGLLRIGHLSYSHPIYKEIMDIIRNTGHIFSDSDIREYFMNYPYKNEIECFDDINPYILREDDNSYIASSYFNPTIQVLINRDGSIFKDLYGNSIFLFIYEECPKLKDSEEYQFDEYIHLLKENDIHYIRYLYAFKEKGIEIKELDKYKKENLNKRVTMWDENEVNKYTFLFLPKRGGV